VALIGCSWLHTDAFNLAVWTGMGTHQSHIHILSLISQPVHSKERRGGLLVPLSQILFVMAAIRLRSAVDRDRHYSSLTHAPFPSHEKFYQQHRCSHGRSLSLINSVVMAGSTLRLLEIVIVSLACGETGSGRCRTVSSPIWTRYCNLQRLSTPMEAKQGLVIENDKDLHR